MHELAVQFEGLHLQWPDVTIYRWNQGNWGRSDPVAQLLGVPEQAIHLAKLLQFEGRFVIEFQVFAGSAMETPNTARYAYQPGALNKLSD